MMSAGDERIYYSADSMEDEDEAAVYPIEFLNSLQPSGAPSHELRLKVGAPIMLLRNMNAALGLANGTRLIVQSMLANVLQAEIVTGRHAGNSVLIPRITIEPSDERMPFTFRRHQFPVRPAFAMTINKAQGQTFQHVGIFLPRPCFAHGQLYVAMSRVGEPGGVTIQTLEGGGLQQCGRSYTQNVVYHEVLG